MESSTAELRSPCAPTPRQAEILSFIRSRPTRPTLREIAAHFGIRSVNGVHGHLKRLERAGLITREYNTARAITLTRPDPIARINYAGLLRPDGLIDWSGAPPPHG